MGYCFSDVVMTLFAYLMPIVSMFLLSSKVVFSVFFRAKIHKFNKTMLVFSATCSVLTSPKSSIRNLFKKQLSKLMAFYDNVMA